MLKSNPAQRGMSLVELAVAMVIVGILLALAAPSYNAWIQNTKIRTTAEAMLNGLQLARAEAVRRNTRIRFYLTDNLTAACQATTTGINWVVSFDNPDPAGNCDTALLNDAVDPNTIAGPPATPPRLIQIRSANEGSGGVAVALTLAGTGLAGPIPIMFNGLGRITPVPAATINLDVSNPAAGTCAAGGGPVRCMRVTVSTGGQVRMCDPARPSTDPVGC